MKSLTLLSLLGGLLATVSLAQAQTQDNAPAVLNNVIFNGTITSATGGAATTGHINSLLGSDGTDYTLQSDGSLTNPDAFTYTKTNATTGTLSENAVDALPGVNVTLTFTSGTTGNFTATYTGGSTQVGTFTLVPVGAVAPLVNVSTLTDLASGGSAITGFVIAGNGPHKVLIRAVGPTLGQYGVSNPLADPSITVWRGTQAVATNDNWNTGSSVDSTLPAAFTQVGAFQLPNGSKDSAVIVTLAPGVYSAQIFGNGSSTGRVLLEVYLIQ